MTFQSSKISDKSKRTFSDPWREIALFAYLIMELCWIVTWFRLITGISQGTSVLSTFIYFGGLIYANAQLARIHRRFSLKVNVYRIATGILLIVGVVIGIEVLVPPGDQLTSTGFQNHFNLVDSGIWIPAELVILIVVFLSWRHGTNLAREWIGPLLVMRGFKIGLILLLIYGLLGLALPTVNLNQLLVVYLLSSLAAMTTARIGGLSRISRGQRASMDWRRFSGIFLAIAGTVGAAMAVVAVIGSKQTITFLANLIAGIYTWIARAFILILFPIYYFLIELLEGWFANLDLTLPEPPQMPTPTPTLLPGTLPEDPLAELQPSLLEQNPWLINIVIWVGLLAGLVLILVFLRSRTRWADGENFDQGEIESIIGRDSLLNHLRRSLGWGRMAFGDRLSRLSNLGRERAAARIRRIYEELLNLSRRLGQPRTASTTPLEFLPQLEGLFPNHCTDLRVITYAYVRIRYGELPETRQEVDAVEIAWKRVFAEGESILRVKKNQ